MQNNQTLKALLKEPKNIVILTHAKPDADALGSSLGLRGILMSLGHAAWVISPTDYPDFLTWMPGNGSVINFEEQQDRALELIKDCDLMFFLDFNSLDRIEGLEQVVRDRDVPKVMIDHHLEPEQCADYMFCSNEAAATAELIYEWAKNFDFLDHITPDIADCLYAGIMTDTGNFRHSNTTKNVHMITAELISLGADIHKVSSNIYDNNELDRLRLTGFALLEKLVWLKEYNAAYITLTREDLKKFNFQTGDTEGLVNYALSIKGVKVAALILEKEDGVKISFRSRYGFSVNDFARQHFNGGGHKNAAGGNSDLTIEETEAKFIASLKLYQDHLS